MSSVNRYVLIVLTILSMSMAVSGQGLSTVSGVGSDDPIVFILTGQGSGTLDGVPFGVDAPMDFVISAIGDAADRTDLGSGWDIDHTAAAITIAGLGTAFFATETQTFVDNTNQQVGFSRSDGANLFEGPQDPAFQTWDMTVAVGPAAGTGSLLQWNVSEIATSRGVLVFDDGSGPANFNAIPSNRVFIHESQGSGTLDGVPFGVDAPEPFVFVGAADADARNGSEVGWNNRHTAAAIIIANVGPLHLVTDTVTYVNNQQQVVGFSTLNLALFIGPDRPVFETWDMTTAIGPLAGGGLPVQWDEVDVMTTGGTLLFDGIWNPASFTMLSENLLVDGFESGDTSAWSATVP